MKGHHTTIASIVATVVVMAGAGGFYVAEQRRQAQLDAIMAAFLAERTQKAARDVVTDAVEAIGPAWRKPDQ